MRATRTYDVTRIAPAVDAGGGNAGVPVLVGQVRIDIGHVSERERVLAHQAGEEHTHVGYKRPGEIVIERGDRLDGDGNHFLVIGTVFKAEARRWVLRLLRREPATDG